MTLLPPEQARELVAYFGSKAGAARETGVPRGTLRGWLEPERARERSRRYYAEHREQECERSRERHWALTGFAYTKRLHQIDMARRKRRIKVNEKRRSTEPFDERLDKIVAEGIAEQLGTRFGTEMSDLDATERNSEQRPVPEAPHRG